MTRYTSHALVGALALAAAALIPGAASAMPASHLSAPQLATSGAVEQVRFIRVHRGFRHRFYPRRRFYHRRPGIVRRVLRHL